MRSRGLNIYETGENLPITLKKNVKNFNHIAPSVEFSVNLSTNSFGLRGNEIEKNKPLNTYRILLLGDSMTFGWGVNNNETFAAILENMLNEQSDSGIKYEVLNAAFTAGKSLDTYYIYLKEQGLTFSPDLVIINFFPFNDYTDLTEMNWDSVDENGLPLKISSKNQEVENGYLVSSKNKDWKYQIPIIRNSHAAILFMNFLEIEAPNVAGLIKKQLDLNEQESKGEYGPFEDRVRYCITTMLENHCDTGFYPYITRTEKLFTATRDLVNDNNSKLLVTILPWPDQIKLMQTELNGGRPIEDFNPNKKIREFLKSNNIAYLDLLPRFANANTKEYFYEIDGHFNRRGNDTTAEELYNFLTNNISDLGLRDQQSN